MSVREIAFASGNGRDTIRGWVYTPLSTPKAVIQLVHGFGEHSRRYLHMISAFNEAGYVVCADDHIGHGKTGADSGTLGDPGTKGKDGWKVYLQDEKSLHDLVHKEFPDLPYLMFGHSWGSMELKGSQTEKNLQTAFAGESQARNKYTYFAEKAREEGM